MFNQAIREKEKGDWKKLSIQDKKTLYRASFRQTFAEIEAPTGEWKSVVGITCLGIAFSLWICVWLKHYGKQLNHYFDSKNQKQKYK